MKCDKFDVLTTKQHETSMSKVLWKVILVPIKNNIVIDKWLE